MKALSRWILQGENRITIQKSCVAIPSFSSTNPLVCASHGICLLFASCVSDLWVLLAVSQSNAKTWEWSNLTSLAWKSVSTLPAPLRLILIFHISLTDLFNSTLVMLLCGVTYSLMLLTAYVVISSLGSVHTWFSLPVVPLLLPANVWSYRRRLELVSSRGCL